MTEARTSYEAVSSQMEEARRRIEKKRMLAAKCHYYYPITQRDEHGTQQVAAAETIQGAVTIKETFERRNPDAYFDIGPRSIVFSDELIRLEFAPTEAERFVEGVKLAQTQQALKQLDSPDPEYIKNMLEEIGG